MIKLKSTLKLLAVLLICFTHIAVASSEHTYIDNQITAHPNQSGIYVLDKGEDALLARDWLADHAEKTIEVQYFIGVLTTSAYWPQKPYCARMIEV